MPIYEYQCDECGLKIEKLFNSYTDAPESIDCEECGAPLRKLISAVNHTFAHVPTGPVPQNTGVSQIDHNYDRVIGRDAEQKWKTIEERNKVKRAVLREAARSEGVVGGLEHLVRTRDGAGEYRLVKEDERKEINARRTVAEAVAKAASKQATGE